MSEKLYKNEIKVKLVENESGARKVVVCPHVMELDPGPVCWVRDPESPLKFDFKELLIASPPFNITEQESYKICAETNAQYSLFWYTIVIKGEGGQVYDSFQPRCEGLTYNIAYRISGDKPVIRPR